MNLEFFENLASSAHYSDLSEIQYTANINEGSDNHSDSLPFANETHVFEIR